MRRSSHAGSMLVSLALTSTVALLLAMMLSLPFAAPALACTGSCVDDTDCAFNDCRYCDTGFGVCGDCCEFINEITCPPACTWDAGSSQCRNVASTSCTVQISEIPTQHRYWLFALFPLLAAAAVAWLRWRRRTGA